MADVIRRVRDSCAAAAASSVDVTIDDEAVESFAAQIVREVDGEAMVPPLNLPLRFRSVDEELNSWFLLQLMNIGSGFRDPLKASTGAGAWDTMLRGLLGMHISGVKINADLLNRVDINSIESWFGFPVSVEVEIMPAVRQTKPGPLRPLAEHLIRLMTEAGHALRSRAFDDFASFLRAGAASERAKALASGAATAETWKPSAAAFVARIVEAFPGFRDVHTLRRAAGAAVGDGGAGGAAAAGGAADGGASPAAAASTDASAAAPAGAGVQVWILKKAQLAAAHLHRRFAARMPEVFGFPEHESDGEGSVASLTVMADNVLPAVLRAAGVLRYSAGLAAVIDSGEPLPAGDREVDLRACAVVASARLAVAVRARAAEALTALEAGAAPATAPAAGGAATSSAASPAEAAPPTAEAAGSGAAAGAGEASAAPAPAAASAVAPPVQTASSLRRLAHISEADLDEWLWMRGKDPELRRLRRHYTRDTYFY